MPKPNKGESRKDYMARCVPVLIKEGKKQDQAVAICSSMFKDHNMQNVQRITFNISGKPRKEKFQGRDFLAVPTVMIVEGVLHGNQGPIMYPGDVCEKSVPL